MLFGKILKKCLKCGKNKGEINNYNKNYYIMDLFEIFSSRENLKVAYRYVQDEIAHSSLSITPIDYASTTAINNLGEQFFIALEKYIRDGKYAPEKGFFVYVPKDNLGLRPVCIPSMTDRIVYQAILNQRVLGYKIDNQLSDKVCFANRVNCKEDDENYLSYYLNGYDTFLKRQTKAFEKGFTWKLEVDVQQFFENIPIKKLIEKLKNEFGIRDGKILSILQRQLNTWVEYEDLPKGLPQGYNASCVLSNAYLNALDRFAEDKLITKEILYFRYADDIVLMGKSKEVILRTIEKMVHFLRDNNLNLNEKTNIIKLKDSSTIQAMRIFSDYEDNTPEIPEDEFAKIQANVPITVDKILSEEKVEKLEMRELRYYLKVGKGYGDIFLLKLIEIIPLYPSLTVLIIKYVSEGRRALELSGDQFEVDVIDITLWKTYKSEEVLEWSKFWILKLLASNKKVYVKEINREVKKILISKSSTIFKIVGFYFQAISGQKINIELVKKAVIDSTVDVERSWYSFFFLNAFEGVRTPIIKDCIEKALNSNSQELNLIGSYLFQSKPQIKIDDIEGSFASYILKKKVRTIRMAEKKIQTAESEYYLVRRDALLPVASPASIFGVSRKRRLKHTIELSFPEKVNFEKVTLKMKEGLQEMEIWYNGKHLETADYIKLGFFAGKKQQKPDRAWGFIAVLSALQATDITRATAENMKPMVVAESGVSLSTANIHQIKKTLTNRMRAIFKTDDNPFHNNKKYYEPRFTILPSPTLRHEEVWQQGGKLNENLPNEEI